MKHIKYHSLINSYREKEMDAIQVLNAQQEDDDWLVTEKVHGANFSIHISVPEREMRFASRNQFVDESFFNARKMTDNLKTSFLALAENVFKEHPDAKRIALFGELFGQGLNKGVSYPAGRHFAMFDIVVETHESEQLQKQLTDEGKTETDSFLRYLDYDDMVRHANLAGVPTVPELFRGPMAEALSFNPHVRSLVGERTDSEFVSPEENWAEGVAIRPNKAFFDHYGHRVSIKNKSEKFKEKEKKTRARKPRSLETLERHPDLPDYITEARLSNVLSKEGEIDTLNFNYVLQMFATDALNEYARDHEVVIDKDETKALKKDLVREGRLTSLVRIAFGFEKKSKTTETEDLASEPAF